MEGIRHHGLVSESGTRGLRRLEVVRNRKVVVDQTQVQRMLNECVNHLSHSRSENHQVFFISRTGGSMSKKMVTPQEKAQCIEWFIEMRSDTQTQHNFRTKYGRNLLSQTGIRDVYNRFKETGSCQKQKGSG